MIRLINVHTAEISAFDERIAPPYAIASHRWTDDETTYKNFTKRRFVDSKGHRKVLEFCAFVERVNSLPRSRGAQLFYPPCEWLWIDTACIDKRDQSEEAEALNSMFTWYHDAKICYAYLSDVSSQPGSSECLMQVMQSEWFTRGWTLQELLAPASVVFTTSDWKVIGQKCYQGLACTCTDKGPNLTYLVSCISGIEVDALSNFHARRSSIPVMQKLAWMAHRATTRPEDRVYCMLGLFDAHLLPKYSEGENNAWLRLAHEIKNGPATRSPSQETNWWIAQYTGASALTDAPTGFRQAYYSTAGKVQPSTLTPSFPADVKLVSRPFQSAAGKIQNVVAGPSHPITSSILAATTCVPVPRQATLGVIQNGGNVESSRGAAHNMQKLYSRTKFGFYDCPVNGCCWIDQHGFQSLDALFRHMQSVHHDG